MPVRRRAALAFAVALLAGLLAAACSAKSAAVVVKHTASLQPGQVTIASINVVSSTVGPVVVGEVHNVSTTAIGGVQVTAALKNTAGASMGQAMFSTTLLHVVPPGSKASFSIPFAEVHGTAGSVSATVQADAAVPLQFVPLTVAKATSTFLGSDYRVTGTVTNSSDSPITYLNVVATFYDHAGHVVGADHDTGTNETLAPGESRPFEITLLEEAPLVARYALAAEGQVVAAGK